MKVIAIKQSFATFTVEGLIEYEFRTYSKKYRGDILIHAGKNIDKEAMKRFEYLHLEYPTSCIIAKARLSDSVIIDDEMNEFFRNLNYSVYEGVTEDKG